MTMDFSAERLSYEQGALLETNLPENPKILLQDWLQQAIDKKIVEPYAMSLATCGADQQPSVRTVLLREVSELPDGQFGLVFYTNYDSQKGRDLAQNPHAQVLFFWHTLERQIRISGQVRKLSTAQSTDYFHKRPHDSQVAAWVSEPQSGMVASRQIMEEKFAQLEQEFAEKQVPKPEFWGGYELIATQIEFWQGRANRMHDRLQYQYLTGRWQLVRLLP